MSSKGIIYLYDSDNNMPVSIKKYQDRPKRRAIIEKWKKIYAGAFYRCYIVISPDLEEDYDFDMMERELDKAVPMVKPLGIKRPKSENKGIYNTPQLYDYGED